jgi:hypothetical protein
VSETFTPPLREYDISGEVAVVDGVLTFPTVVLAPSLTRFINFTYSGTSKGNFSNLEFSLNGGSNLQYFMYQNHNYYPSYIRFLYAIEFFVLDECIFYIFSVIFVERCFFVGIVNSIVLEEILMVFYFTLMG